MSKAILENVIFCHQEESNWPLSEASVLKKKFDDIFDATRYTKALDNIKVMRKERNNDLKVNKAELDALKIDRDRSEALKDKREALQATLEQKQTRLSELDAEIRQITKQNKQFYDSAVKFREIVNLAETLEEMKKLHQQNRESLHAAMTEIDESDEELRRRRDSFQDQLDQQRRRRDGLARCINAKKEELNDIEHRYSRKLSEQGALENDKKHHLQAVAKRKQNIRQMSLELGIRGFDMSDLSDSQIEDFARRLAESVKETESALKALKKEGAEKEAAIANRYQELRTERSSKVSARETTAASFRRLKDRAKQAEDELDCILVSEFDVSALRDRHREDLGKIDKLRQDLEEANYDEQLRKKNNEIRDLEERREELTGELNALNRHAEFRAKLDMKKREREHKLSAAKSLMSRHEASIQKLTGSEVQLDLLERNVARANISNEENLAALERDEADRCRAVQHLESALSISQNQLRDKQDQLSRLQGEVRAFLEEEGDSATDVSCFIDSAEREIEAMSEELMSGTHAFDFFARIMTIGKNQHSCIGCGRGIRQDEQSSFEKYVTGKLKQLSPEGRKELESTVDEWKGVLSQARDLVLKEETAKTLQESEIPALQRTIVKQSQELATKSELAEDAASKVRAARERQDELTSLKRVAQDANRLLTEATTMQHEVIVLEQDLASTGSFQTSDEIQNAMNDITDGIKKLKREAQTIERNREAKRTELNHAERASFRSEKAVTEKEQENNRRLVLQRRVDELSGELEETTEQLRKLDMAIDELGTPIKKARDDLDQLKSNHSEAEERLTSAFASLQAKTRVLNDADERIRVYLDGRGAHKLKECIDKIADLQGQIQLVQGETKEFENEVTKVDKDLNEFRATERNIHDNIRYRQLGAELRQIDDELSDLDLDEASTARKDFEAKYHNQKQVENSLNGESQHLSGEIASLIEQIKARDDELVTDYKDIYARFSKKLVEAKTCEIVNADLERYSKALEQAIIRFHGLKMQEINEQIRYLWAKTYQGSDIDSISIESDTEKAGNRSYNYRVCMMKDSVKMDMRGRCSAGQKVLASIIIRLALADSFATNCRFMALDEPTLCLDNETVGALARSFADIIMERPSTQLIVVTHDQDFLSLLATHTSLDQYWRVGRNEFQKSYIERSRVR